MCNPMIVDVICTLLIRRITAVKACVPFSSMFYSEIPVGILSGSLRSPARARVHSPINQPN